MKYFQHEVPIHSSSMTRGRKRIGETGAEELLKQIIEASLKLKSIKPLVKEAKKTRHKTASKL